MMKKRYLIPILSMLALVGIVGIGVTSAFLTSSDQAVNAFSMGKVDIEPEENGFEDVENWEVGVVDKKVQIDNLSQGPVLIRVSITPRWVNEDGSPWAGNVNLVTLNFDKDYKLSWMLGSDGYYYYMSKVVAQGKTSMLLESVELKEALPVEYKEKTFIVDVDAEAIQATKSAYEAAWKGIPDDVAGMLEKLCQ